ncbi:hypothetical protein LEP1GSC047_3970 [Leptospira inadai serovar Lyme str. 10]|uniref:STAS domain-containing protein n=2 Tax=Leptospira inadai serovar Lyme TaxID=293084 RepID=V6HCM6_9LEPT|nr:hypothetical protein [Leptospira inadai]EQA37686.1 hypothetical protein LEP1GSC047_3970 [Leptospira inadai serovar Lyme str. 10]PNV75129.1 hypothetical protein BES34_009525 [Leptospira inadai serovar Lyme]
MDSLINKEDYEVLFDSSRSVVSFSGSLRLQSLDAYGPIKALLKNASSTTSHSKLVLDFSKLIFLNSSGITCISLFIIETRNNAKTAICVQGSKSIPWQSKSLGNLKKLWPEIDLVIR